MPDRLCSLLGAQTTCTSNFNATTLQEGPLKDSIYSQEGNRVGEAPDSCGECNELEEDKYEEVAESWERYFD